MRFLLDEMLPPGACPGLVRLGHDAVHVADCGLDGRPDAAVAAWARAENRVLVTENVKDFARERDLVLAFVLKTRLGHRRIVESLVGMLHSWAQGNSRALPGATLAAADRR